MACDRRQELTGLGVPEPDVPIDTGRGDGPAIGAVRRDMIRALARDRQDAPSGLRVPDLEGAVVTGRDEASSVRAEPRGIDAIGMIREPGAELAGGGIPEPHRVVVAGGDGLTGWAERHGVHGLVVARESEPEPAGGGLPDPDGAVRVAGGDLPAIRAERHAVDASTLVIRARLRSVSTRGWEGGARRPRASPTVQSKLLEARVGAVGAEGHRAYVVGVSLERGHLVAGVEVPEFHDRIGPRPRRGRRPSDGRPRP